MDHLKEQLKKHYEKTQPSEGFLQKLHTLEAPEPAPVPVLVSRKRRLVTPIAAMLIAAVALLGGGKYLMDMVPPTALSPDSAPTSAVPEIGSAVDYASPEPGSMPTAPSEPVPTYPEETPPEATAPEKNPSDIIAPAPGSADVTAPQAPTSPEPTDPVPPEDITDPKPPIEVEGSADDPTPPPEDDVPPTAPGDDDPPTEPDINAPADEPDKPVDPPDDPVDPPDDPVDPPDDPPHYPPLNSEAPPEISGRYANENGQHMVYLTNCDTGEICTLNLTSSVTVYGYTNIHTVFGCLVKICLNDANPSYPTQSVTPGTSPRPNISEIEFELEIDVICAVTW